MKKNVLEYLENTARLFPNKIAIEDRERSITFADLLLRANSLAIEIKHITNQRNVPIAVFIEKSIDAIESFLGILYAQCFYVPVDVSSPITRTQLIFDNIGLSIIVTNQANLNKIETLTSQYTIINLNETHLVSGTVSIPRGQIDVDPAYLISTSGSTGIPKGVLVSHRSIIDYIDWAIDAYGFEDRLVIGNQAPLVFDNSVLDIYVMLATGAKLILIPDKLFIFPKNLIKFLKDKEVSMIFWVPSLLSNIMQTEALEQGELSDLKYILFAGEVMHSRVYMFWKRKIPNATFSNLYGPTEITVDCTYAILERDYEAFETLPIGKPCANSDVFLLDKDNCLINEFKITGEICVRGTSLALGYYKNPEQTSKAFPQNPLNKSFPEKIYRTGDRGYWNKNGDLIFVGRKDLQIKHLGYRIELGEIETSAATIEEVSTVCVLYDQSTKKINMFFDTNEEISDERIYLRLRQMLPKYMVPSKIIRLKKLPTNVNGKLDRNKMKAMQNYQSFK